ncbi:MAG: hypothetical protein AAF211_17330 [Myxococcota bacterium]
MEGIRYTADGFATRLVKRDEDGWFGSVEPSKMRSGLDGHPLHHDIVPQLVLMVFEFVRHLVRAAPWSPWRFSLARGRLTLRMRGRRQVQRLRALREVGVDDYGLVLHFDDGGRWTIPPQPAAVVDLYELADHLRDAARSERKAAIDEVDEVERARAALRDLRASPERPDRS